MDIFDIKSLKNSDLLILMANIDDRPLIFKLKTHILFLPIYCTLNFVFQNFYKPIFVKIHHFLRFFAKIGLFLMIVVANIDDRPLIFKLITWATFLPIYSGRNFALRKSYRLIYAKKWQKIMNFCKNWSIFFMKCQIYEKIYWQKCCPSY
jgi:hypothetical protein